MAIAKNDFARLCGVKQGKRGLVIVPPKTPLSRKIDDPRQLKATVIKGGRRAIFYTDSKGRKRVITNPKDLRFLSAQAISRLVGKVEKPKLALIEGKDGGTVVKVGSAKVGEIVAGEKFVKYRFKAGSKVCKGVIPAKGKSRSVVKRWIAKKIADAFAVEQTLKKVKLERKLPESKARKPKAGKRRKTGCGCGAPVPPKPINWKAKDPKVFNRKLRSYAKEFDQLPIYMP